MKKNIGERLRAVRRELGLTQAQLAAASGVIQQQISKLERGRARDLGGDTLVRLATALGVRPEWLLDGTEPRAAMPACADARRVYLAELIAGLPAPDRERLFLEILRRAHAP